VLTSLSVAFAAEGVPADTSISVTGLETGDAVNFYQVLKYDETATDTRGWVAAPGFTDLTKAQIQTILGLDSTGKPVTITSENRADYGISAALAATITGMAQTAGTTAAKFKNVGVTSGTATQATTNIGDPDGTEITQEKLSNGTYAGVLQGAAFELYTDCTLTLRERLCTPILPSMVTSLPMNMVS